MILVGRELSRSGVILEGIDSFRCRVESFFYGWNLQFERGDNLLLFFLRHAPPRWVAIQRCFQYILSQCRSLLHSHVPQESEGAKITQLTLHSADRRPCSFIFS